MSLPALWELIIHRFMAIMFFLTFFVFIKCDFILPKFVLPFIFFVYKKCISSFLNYINIYMSRHLCTDYSMCITLQSSMYCILYIYRPNLPGSLPVFYHFYPSFLNFYPFWEFRFKKKKNCFVFTRKYRRNSRTN